MKYQQSLLPIVLITLLAVFLRLQNLGAVEHNVDHAYPISQALHSLEQGVFPITAQGTSVLFANPPLTGYLFLVPLSLSRSPYGVYLFVIALNTLAVPLSYVTARRLLPRGDGFALIVAFLVAVNPWVVEYSRTTWVQCLLPFGVMLVFWLFVPLWLGEAPHPRRRFLFGCAGLAALSQTYLLAFALIAPVALLCLVHHRRITVRTAFIGALMVIIPGVIYGAGLIADGENTLNRIRDFGGDGLRFRTEAWAHLARLTTGWEYAATRGLDAPAGRADAVTRFNLGELANGVGIALMVIGAAAYLRSGRRDFSQTGILVVWGGLLPLLMTAVSRPVHPFYLLLTLPVGTILAVRGMHTLYEGAARFKMGRATAFAGLAALTWFGVLSGVNVVRYAEETLITPGVDGFNALPLQDGVALAAHFAPLLGEVGTIHVKADGRMMESFAGRTFWLDPDVDTARGTTIAADGTLYLLWRGEGHPPPDLTIPDETASYVLSDGEAIDAYRVGWSPPPSIEQWQGISSDGGLIPVWAKASTLLAGQAGEVAMVWAVVSLPPERAAYLYSPFVHLYDGEGKRVLIADGAVTPGALWRVGDLQYKRLTFAIPAEAAPPVRLMMGHYDGVHGRSLILRFPDGREDAVIAIKP